MIVLSSVDVIVADDLLAGEATGMAVCTLHAFERHVLLVVEAYRQALGREDHATRSGIGRAGARRQEAARRGIAVSEVVDEAVRRFVGGAELQRLIEEFRREELAGRPVLSDEDAQRIASEELAEFRRTQHTA